MNPQESTCVVQGFGNVGSISAKLIAMMGVKIIGISDVSGGYYNPDGFDIEKTIAYRDANNGMLDGLKGATLISNEELLTLQTDILVPAAMEDQITKHNAHDIKAKLIVEGANGPTSSDADAIIDQKGIKVVPDILANAGGVTVSYFEWVQNRLGYSWTEERVNRRADRVMKQAFNDVYDAAQKHKCSWRVASYVVAIDKVASTQRLRGVY